MLAAIAATAVQKKKLWQALAQVSGGSILVHCEAGKNPDT